MNLQCHPVHLETCQRPFPPTWPGLAAAHPCVLQPSCAPQVAAPRDARSIVADSTSSVEAVALRVAEVR